MPNHLREASYGLGATRWQTVWNHVLPNAISGILTGVILSVSRAFGETAPLIVVGVSTFIVVDPNTPFSKYTTLPAQIYQWTSRPQQEFQHLAAAAIIVLLLSVVAVERNGHLFTESIFTENAVMTVDVSTRSTQVLPDQTWKRTENTPYEQPI